MDKIEKVLQKFAQKERERVKKILERINRRKFEGLDLKKLKGHNDIFRVRKGNLRIIYRQADDSIFILAVERRREKTYKHF